MKRTFTLTAIAGLAALALTGSLSAAAAGANIQVKTPLTITVVGKLTSGAGSGTFNLLGASTAESDSGRLTYPAPVESLSRKTPDGLSYVVIQRTEALKGKHGTLVIRSSVRRFDVVKEDDFVSTGTWSIVRGTGRYAGLRGGGALVGITQFATKATNFSDYDFSARYTGLVTRA